jgi:hypothetical protein
LNGGSWTFDETDICSPDRNRGICCESLYGFARARPVPHGTPCPKPTPRPSPGQRPGLSWRCQSQRQLHGPRPDLGAREIAAPLMRHSKPESSGMSMRSRSFGARSGRPRAGCWPQPKITTSTRWTRSRAARYGPVRLVSRYLAPLSDAAISIRLASPAPP